MKNIYKLKIAKLIKADSFIISLLISCLLIILIFSLQTDKINRLTYELKNEQNNYLNNKTIFFGDSITELYNLNKHFKNENYLNKGISGNTTSSLLARIKESVLDYNPSRVILLIGANDLSNNIDKEDIIKNIEKIVKIIKENNSKTKIYVESIMPVNSVDEKLDNGNVLPRNNNDIKYINSKIEIICKKENITYINIFDKFTDKEGNFSSKYTNDGLHPNEEGFKHLTKILNNYGI